jgi:hypothetical protein
MFHLIENDFAACFYSRDATFAPGNGGNPFNSSNGRNFYRTRFSTLFLPKFVAKSKTNFFAGPSALPSRRKSIHRCALNMQVVARVLGLRIDKDDRANRSKA